MYNVLTLNNISPEGLKLLPADKYNVGDKVESPDAILLRSYKMHGEIWPATVKAVARAGAGVNNIPIDEFTARGVPVFNAPGANANAVKELVISGMLLAARNLCQAYDYTQSLKGDGDELNKQVEAGKKKFVGYELPGRTLGVIGLGAIGVQVANAAHALGMNVIGFDNHITVSRAWQLSAGVEQARSLEDLFGRSDMVTLHVPLLEDTKNLVNAKRIAMMNKHGVVMNFARGGIVDDAAVLASLDAGHLGSYVTDFPSRELLDHDKVITLPHLGASTEEAETNCAIMVAQNMRDYLEHGIVRYSVNFPEADMPRSTESRITIANENKPNMVAQISTCLAEANLNVEDLLNKSRGNIAYTIVDLDSAVPASTLDAIRAIKGVLNVRCLGQCT
jgi:D-3-phosphoglycerate dehydrogenase